MTEFPLISFHQFQSELPEDELLMFAAPAKVLATWAGIPRKGWRIRMLFQRWITPERGRELREFWNTAASPKRELGQAYILGPTAITVAIQGELQVTDGKINIAYTPAIDLKADATGNLGRLAEIVTERIVERLSNNQKALVSDFVKDPLQELPDVSHDYVLEFALQLTQMARDPQWFVDENDISTAELNDLVIALEAICRPAIVVDGQHRLIGATEASHDIWLPVVAMPRCQWTDQIYQFVVINDKAQKVESSLLTDIFGSSLTKVEQGTLRERLARANVNVEARIAAVIADRDDRSPFKNMVKVKLKGAAPAGAAPYITDTTIRLLIDGNTRNTLGWREDDDFYKTYVKPTFPDREQWNSWSSGLWRPYWFAFWQTVRDYYNEQGAKLKPPQVLWNTTVITNLTKGVTLRMFQKLFMREACKRIEEIYNTSKILIDELGEEIANQRIQKRIAKQAIPSTPEEFAVHIRGWFLEEGVPVKVFTHPWIKSLDDQEGQQLVFDELEKAFEKGESYRIKKNSIFDIKEAAEAKETTATVDDSAAQDDA